MNALGQALADHRAACHRCTRYGRRRACRDYLNIARGYTVPRQRWDGPTAPRTILSVREAR